MHALHLEILDRYDSLHDIVSQAMLGQIISTELGGLFEHYQLRHSKENKKTGYNLGVLTKVWTQQFKNFLYNC